MPNADEQTIEEIDMERLQVAMWGRCLYVKFNSLTQWVVGVTAEPPKR